jgi:3-phosphoshikimate 1-carboxyvinyltransferase
VTPAADSDACEPLGSIRVRGGVLKGTTVGGAEIPDLIDELPLVAVAGALAEGTTAIRDAAELRVKESDRIASMAANLRLLGVTVREWPDGMEVEGPARLKGGVTVDSYGDHRLPMALSVLAGAADGPVRMRNTACVAKSYPEFWDDWRKAGGHAE